MEGVENYKAHHSHDPKECQETFGVCDGQFAIEHQSNTFLHEAQVHEDTIPHQAIPTLQGICFL